MIGALVSASMQIIRSPELYDVCIVGSGAGGGMAAHVLTAAGANCVMLEAGPMWDTRDDGFMFKWPYDSPRRGASTPQQQFGEFDAGLGGWTLEGEPYTVADDQDFDWFRTRMLGGRTNHWGRISLRYGPDDFKRRSTDGLGDDWPIGYDDLAPYYDKIDRLIGIFGSAEGLPNDPDGIFMDPPEPRCWEKMIKQGADRLGITCIPSRLSILTRPLNGRSACHYCGQCNRGCATRSNFSSPTVLLPPALDTGLLRIIPNAMARQVTLDGDGGARGVSYVNKDDGREYEVRARIVVLAASACETARLLLNSKSALFPDGLANTHGNVGRYLTDNTGTDVAGFIPRLMDNVPHNEDGAGGAHLFMPWWLGAGGLDFPRGYHIEIWGGRGMPSYGFMGGIHRLPSGGGYGARLKDDYRRYYGSVIGFSGRGEMIPNRDSYCEIDPDTVDRWGIPVLRFHFKWGAEEILQVRHMQETFRGLIDELGGTALSEMPSREDGYGILAGGRIIHELGVTRMGHDPRTSVLNAHCRAHDVDNLFVTDGGPFVTNGDKNPTWTILALAMRTSEYIVEQRNQGAI